MMFLDRKDPVVDIKELLYARLEALSDQKQTNLNLRGLKKREIAIVSFENAQIDTELNFITNLLDTKERS